MCEAAIHIDQGGTCLFKAEAGGGPCELGFAAGVVFDFRQLAELL